MSLEIARQKVIYTKFLIRSTGVEKIYSFMYPEYNPVYSPASPRTMGSAQITGLAISAGNMLSWRSLSYGSTLYYSNYETGYKVYHRTSNASAWNLIATIPASGSLISYSLPSNIMGGECKVTSYNSSGDSFDPPVIAIPTTLALTQNDNFITTKDVEILDVSPSPATTTSKVRFFVKKASPITIEIVDQLGKVCGKLLDDEYKATGEYEIDNSIDKFISGTYQYRIRSNSSVHSKLVVVVK